MRIHNLLFIILGFIFIGIGMIGIALPVLPTTPFLILASISFMKGSDRFDLWFRSTNLYKNYAEDFLKDRSMTLRRKITLLLLSDFMLILPLVKINNIFLRILIISIILIKYYYFIFKIKTKKH